MQVGDLFKPRRDFIYNALPYTRNWEFTLESIIGQYFDFKTNNPAQAGNHGRNSLSFPDVIKYLEPVGRLEHIITGQEWKADRDFHSVNTGCELQIIDVDHILCLVTVYEATPVCTTRHCFSISELIQNCTVQSPYHPSQSMTQTNNPITSTNNTGNITLSNLTSVDVLDEIECIQSFKGNFNFFDKGDKFLVDQFTNHSGVYSLRHTYSAKGLFLHSGQCYTVKSELQYFQKINQASPVNKSPVASLTINDIKMGDEIVVKKALDVRSGNQRTTLQPGDKAKVKQITSQWIIGDVIVIETKEGDFSIYDSDLSNFEKKETEAIKAYQAVHGCDHLYDLKEIELFTSTIKTLICRRCGEEKK